MFEPKTYHEKIQGLYTATLKQLISYLPVETQQQFQNSYRAALSSEQLLKVSEAERVLGPVDLGADERCQLTWALELLSRNIGRTFFGNSIRAATHEGALATKSFGVKYKAWLKSLPDLDESMSAEMASGFYADNTLTPMGQLPRPYFVAAVNDQLIFITPGRARLYAQQLYIKHLPENFNWAGAREEIFPYRADVSRGAIAVALAQALMREGITTFIVPFESNEAVMQALSDAELDKQMTIKVEADATPIEQIKPDEMAALSEADEAEETPAEEPVVDTEAQDPVAQPE